MAVIIERSKRLECDGRIAGAGATGLYVTGEAAEEGGRFFGGDREIEPVVGGSGGPVIVG